MRKTCDSWNQPSTRRFSSFADSRSVPNGFSMMIRTSDPSWRFSPLWPSASEITGKNDGAVDR